jgi:threonine dehydrogenase-like Zn-dependent dehydrogenase
MRALSLRGPREACVVEAADPTPDKGEVVVRIRACGICGSDLNAWRGVPGIEYPLPPGAPGHEAFGEVVAVGRGVDGLQAGQVVTGLLWNGFAEFGVARADHLVTVPSRVGQAALLGEPLACASNVVRRASIRPGERVAFVGFGYLAALMAYLLPSPVGPWVALSRRDTSRSLALRLGAEAAFDFASVPAELWDSFPVVVECAGVQQTLDFATWLTAFGGRLIIAGYHADGPRTVNMQSWNWKGLDVINAHERDPAVLVARLRDALAVLGPRTGEVCALHTHSWPLDETAAAFRAAEQRPSRYVKGVIYP